MVLRIVIKLYESLEKNISQHSNNLLHYPESYKLDIEGTKHETKF